MEQIRVVHYLNQFFGQIGGEEKANIEPFVKEEAVGPGNPLVQALGNEFKIVGTVICGDSYFNENIEKATEQLLSMIEQLKPDLLIAGPAFNAGRYGIACGAVCAAVQEKLNIPVVTGMYKENPGVELYKKSIFIVETGSSAAKMRNALPDMAKLAIKIAKNEKLGIPEEEKYIPRGIRKNIFHPTRGSTRAVDMLVKKINGDEFTTEYPMPEFDRVTPRNPIKDITTAKIALVTSGGIVPKDNPDKIESSSASKYGKYAISTIDNLTEEKFETAHGGYDPVYANIDADRVLPVDVLKQMEKENLIGELHDYFYSTVGNGTSVANAKKYAHEIGNELKKDNIDGIILTST